MCWKATLAVLSLALGIGANTAIYSFMDSILLRSLPVPNPESLVVLKWRTTKDASYAMATKGISWSTDGSHSDGNAFIGTNFPYPALELFQKNSDVLSAAFCYFGINRISVTVHENTEALKGQYVSGNYFQGMQLTPVAGRLLRDEDDVAGAPPVVALSYRLARSRFGDVTAAPGQTVLLNNHPFSVVGVVPADFFGAEPGSIPDVYLPMHANMILSPNSFVSAARQFIEPGYYWIEVMGRLKPGVDIAKAQAVLEAQFRGFVEATRPGKVKPSDLPILTVEPGGAGLDSLRRRYAEPIYILLTMVGLILLIACANIANLLLARAVSRRQEIAIRLSIGAGRMRVIRQLLTESIALSSIGGLLGVGFAAWGIRVLTVMLANGRENFTLHAQLNWSVLAVTTVLSVLTGLLFGIAPAIQATRAIIGRTHRPYHGLRLTHGLIVAQIALSLLLLAGAGVFTRTVVNLHSIRLGFARDSILLFVIHPGSAGYESNASNTLYKDLLGRLKQVSGVRSVSFATMMLPASGGSGTQVSIDGEQTPASIARLFSVGPGFFDTMQMPLLRGREFNNNDNDAVPKICIVNERLARMFGLTDPVGRTLRTRTSTYQIVGLVKDAIAFNLKEEYLPVVYFPYLQGGTNPAMIFQLRTATNPLSYATTVQQIVRQLDSRVAVSDIQTQADHIDQAISSELTLARLCGVFSLLALTIACIGLYGTVAFNVARRTAEIGIRMALGAQGGRILRMVLREIVLLAAIGLTIGIPIVLAVSRYVKSFMYGIEPNDPLSVTLAVLTLIAAGMLSAFIPACRAARIDPMTALRHD